MRIQFEIHLHFKTRAKFKSRAAHWVCGRLCSSGSSIWRTSKKIRWQKSRYRVRDEKQQNVIKKLSGCKLKFLEVYKIIYYIFFSVLFVFLLISMALQHIVFVLVAYGFIFLFIVDYDCANRWVFFFASYILHYRSNTKIESHNRSSEKNFV